MKNTIKKLLVICLCLNLSVSILGNSNILLNLKAMTTSEVVQKLDSLKSQYVNTKWTRSYAGGTQCYAFAHYIFNTIFGRGEKQVGNGAVSSNSTCYKLNNVASDISVIGTLSPGYSDSALEQLLEKAAPGDYIQVKRSSSGGPHSMIVYSVDKSSNNITIFDANTDGAGTVKFYSQSFSTFKSKNSGVSLYRYYNYSPSELTCNCSTSYAGTYRVTTSSLPLTIRSGHGSGYSQLGTMPKDSTCTVTKADGSWAHITYNGISGYASMEYLTKVSTAPTSYSIQADKTEMYDSEIITITITPNGENITNYIFHLIAPDGRTTTLDKGTSNVLKGACPNVIGEWTVYGEIKNSSGTYKGSASNKSLKFTVKKPNFGSVQNLGDDFYAKIKSYANNRVLTHESGSVQHPNVYTSSDNNQSNQIFRFKRQSDGSYVIHSKANENLVLDAYDGGYTNGTNIWMHEKNDTDAQKWYLYKISNGNYFIRTSKCQSSIVDVDVNNENIQLYTYHGENNQQFMIEKVYTTTALSLNSSNSATISTAEEMKRYTFTPSASGKYVIYSTGSADTKVYLYNASGTELSSDDDGGDDRNFRLEYNLTAGTKYTYGVRYYGSTTGTISFKFGNVHTISYNANGGTGAPSAQSKDYGKTATISSITPTRSGYTFQGWATSSSATSASYQPGSSYSSNASIALYAVWKENTQSLSLNSSNSATISTAEEMKRYTFTPSASGKYVIYSTGSADTKVYLYNASGTELSNDDDGGDDRNFRLEYNLTAGTKYTYGVRYYGSTTGTISFKFGNVYTIFYNANGGTGAPSAQRKDYGKTATISSTTPTRSGYTFQGWATSSSATSASYQPGSSYSSNTSIALYAVWKENTQSLSLNSSNSATISTAEEMKRYTFTPSASGKYVIYSTGSADTKVYLYNASGTELSSDDDGGDNSNFRLEYNLTAGTKYTYGVRYYGSTTGTISFKFGNVYTISYNANGGTGAPSAQSKDYGKTATISSTTPTRSGYIFQGWATSSSATSASYQPGSSYSSDSSVTLYAVWDVEKCSHNYTSKVTKESTCTSDGIRTYTCSRCNDSYTTTINKSGHSYNNYFTTDVEATCTAAGSKSRHCSQCNVKTEVTTIYSTGCQYDAGVVERESTCISSGLIRYTCHNCGKSKTETIVRNTHSYESSIIDEATCLNTGLKEQYCTECGYSRVDIIPRLNHTYKTVTTKATISKNGRTEKECTSCGYVTSTKTISRPKTFILSTTSYTYDGKAKKPSVKVKDSAGNILEKDVDYTLKYESGRKATGKYAVTVTFKGKYIGKKTLYFNILPSKTSKITISKTTSSIKASWNKVTGASGYKIVLLNSSGKTVKTITTTKTTCTFKKLSKGTKYKVKVTAYKNIDSKKVYSTTSKTVATSTKS